MITSALRLLGIVLTALPIAGAKVEAGSLPLTRGIYWNLKPTIALPDGQTRVSYLTQNGISRVHIWLNDNGWKRDPECNAFTYADDIGTVLWKNDELRAFIRELRDAKIDAILTFSPQEQTKEYITSLSGPDGPLQIAREFGLPVELDLEKNFDETVANNRCQNSLPPPVATSLLIDAIKDRATPPDRRKPLTLIASTTFYTAKLHKAMLAAADYVSAQLYDARRPYTRMEVSKELDRFWLSLRKPLIPSLILVCEKDELKNGQCSESIFRESLNYVGTRIQCGSNRMVADSYVMWSAVAATQGRSSFAPTYLRASANAPLVTECR